MLILVRDVLGAGLMGALAEAEGRVASFPFDGERADVAVRRMRPAAVLLDGYHPAARSEAFFAAVEACQSRVVLFAPSAPWVMLEEIARTRTDTTLVVPQQGESLAELIGRALRLAPEE